MSIVIGTPIFISVLIYFSAGGGMVYPAARPYSHANQCSIDGGGCLRHDGVGEEGGGICQHLRNDFYGEMDSGSVHRWDLDATESPHFFYFCYSSLSGNRVSQKPYVLSIWSTSILTITISSRFGRPPNSVLLLYSSFMIGRNGFHSISESISESLSPRRSSCLYSSLNPNSVNVPIIYNILIVY